MITKSVCLLDTPHNFDESDEESVNNPDYALVDDMILVKGFCGIGTSYFEQDIRKEIAEMLQQKFSVYSNFSNVISGITQRWNNLQQKLYTDF